MRSNTPALRQFFDCYQLNTSYRTKANKIGFLKRFKPATGNNF